jgi:hypothetical protein
VELEISSANSSYTTQNVITANSPLDISLFRFQNIILKVVPSEVVSFLMACSSAQEDSLPSAQKHDVFVITKESTKKIW